MSRTRLADTVAALLIALGALGIWTGRRLWDDTGPHEP